MGKRSIPRLWRTQGSLRWLIALAAMLAMTLVSSALAIPITVIDDGGKDDVAGQKDLSSMTVDYQPNNGYDLTVSWNWDEISLNGNNTGDACSLFDSDGDGNANYSLCVVWNTDHVYQNTILYSCGDGRADRCDQPIAIVSQDLNKDGQLDGNYSSTCAITTGPDPFHPGQTDTVATCKIKLSDFGVQTDPFLLNVCSYPSGSPNSDPSDCVARPNSGFLTIIKDAGSDTTTGFSFGLNPQSNDKRSTFSITGSGSVALIPVDATINYTLSEAALPAGWQFDTASCVTNGTATGTLNGTSISNIDIQVGKETVCTFKNKHITPTITVDKSANPTSVPENGGTVTYTYKVTNTTAVPLTISSLLDDKFGTLAGDADCNVNTILQPGASCDFTTTQTISGNAGTSHTNIFTAIATASWGATATANDNAVVTFTDVPPTLAVTKTANPTSVPESGGNVTFTYTVKNTSFEAVTITALSDDKFGTLAGDADCQLGTLLAAGASCSFDYTTTLSGNAGTTHTNTFTATVKDDDGSTATATATATVTFTDVAPTLVVTKDANPTSLPETGGNVTYTYTVKNTSFEPVTITALSDDKFGVLAGGPGCAVGTVLQPGASCSFSYTTAAPLVGEPGTSHVNVFTASVKDDDGSAASASDDATVTFTDVPPTLEVTKDANPTSVPETGGSVTFSYTVKNTSFEPVTITALTDNKFGALTGDADCQVGTVLAPGASCSFDYSTILSGDAGSSHVNVFTAVAKDNDNSTATATDDATVNFSDVKPDVAITKTADPTSVPETGASVTYTFVVTNNTAEPAKITVLHDDKFGDLAGDADCKVGVILPGNGSCTFTYTSTISGDFPGSHVNMVTVTVSDDEGNTDSASDDATVDFSDVLPDISVTKEANPTSVPETGGSVTFSFTVKNNSTEDATITSLSDDKFGTLAGDADCKVGTVLAAGASCTFEYSTALSGNAGGSHVNVFTATASDNDGNSDSASDDATVSYSDVLPDISVTKTADPSSVPETGGSVTFSYTVTNNSKEAATIDSLSDDKFGTLTGNADCKVGTVLAGGASCSFSYSTTLSGEAGTQHVNVFTAAASDNDGNSDTASDDATVSFSDVLPTIAVVKTASPTTVPETGGSVTFAFKVTNTGLEAVTISSLSDSVFGTLSGSADCKVGTLLQPGESCIFTLTQTVSGDYPNSHVNVFTAEAKDNEGNTASSNDDATVSYTDVLPDVSVVKTAMPNSVPETGGEVTFYFTVKNNSTEDATITSLGDDKFGTLAGDADCQVSTVLAAGASCDFSIVRTISGSYPGSHTNVFTAAVSDDDGNSATASDDAVVSFSDVKPEVMVTKSADPSSVPETGDNVTFSFTVKNTGAVTAWITNLSDSVFGTLAGAADCKVGTELAPAASCTFTLTKWISGNYGTDHQNVFTATVEDDDGNPASDNDDETVVLTDVKPDVSVTKTASPSSVPETGGNVTFTFTVTNNSKEDATISVLHDSVFGNLAGDADCKVGTVLTGGSSCSFSLTEWISGTANTQHSNVFTTTVTDNDGNTDDGSDDETVDITDVKPAITVDKSANPTSVPETGADVVFTFKVTNTGTVPASITALSDSVFGTLAGDADCKVGTLLAPGASCEFSITKRISGEAGTTHHNVFTATVKDNEGNPASDDDDQDIGINDVKPTLEVSKTANPTSVPETGGDVTFTFVVKNTSGEPVTITALSDSVFGTLAGDDDCKVGTVLAPGASCEFSITRTISGNYGNDHSNVFTATAEDNDGNAVSDDDSEAVVFTDVKPDITIDKSADPKSVPETGANVTFTFTVTNNGAEAATITVLHDSVFGDLAGDADCKVGTVLAGGTSCSFTLTKWISGDVGTPHHNVATVTVKDDDGNSDTDDDDETVDITDVKPTVMVTKTANPTSVPETGGDVTFSFVVKNTSGESVTITALSDSTFGTLAGDADCQVGTVLAAGASCEFTLTKRIEGNTGTDHVNVFTATVKDNEGNSVSDDDDATVVLTDVKPSVTVTKTANPTSVPETGGDVTFTFVVTNNSAEAATITVLSDSVFGALAGDADCKVGTILAPGASCEFSITRTISGNAGGVHHNVFSATVSDNDGNSASDDDDATVTLSDVKPSVTVSKTANPTTVPETGGSVTYSFTVTNNSLEAVSIVSLVDNKFGALAGDEDCKVGTLLAPGASCEFSITRTISGNVGANHVNVFTATVADNDNNTASDDDDATVSFSDVKPTLEVTKTANPTTVPESGANVTYTFVVKNTSGEPVTITALVDNKFGTLAGSASCKIGTVLAPGASCTFTLVKWISGDYPGSHINVFTATAKDDEGNAVSDDDDATVTFSDVLPDIVITKTANPTAVPSTGGNVTFTFVVWNKSTEPATLSSLTDTVFGNLSGKGTCSVPQTLAASDGTQGGADSYTCTYTVFIKAGAMSANGMGYLAHINVATAIATDDDGNSDSASDDATVSFTWRGRTPGYWKNHPTEWPKLSITNYKGVTIQVTTKTLVRDVFNVPTTSAFSCIGSKDTLLTALSYKGGSSFCNAVQILLRAATSGLLNEAYFGNEYPAFASTQELIKAVNAAIASGNRQTVIDLAARIDYWNNGIH